MKRSRLKDKSNKTCSVQDLKPHKIQYNIIATLKKKTYFKGNLPKGKNVQNFWYFCAPYYIIKGNNEAIILVKNDKC